MKVQWFLLITLTCTQPFAESISGNVHLSIIQEDRELVMPSESEPELAQEFATAFSQVASYLNVQCENTVYIFLHSGAFWIGSNRYVSGGATRSALDRIDLNIAFDDRHRISVDKHELTHFILEKVFGRSRSLLVSEGFAVFVEDQIDGESYGGRSILESVSNLRIYPLKHLFMQGRNMPENEFYPLAGEVLTWLKQRYGLEKCKQLYLASTQEGFGSKAITHVLGEEFSNLEADFAVFSSVNRSARR